MLALNAGTQASSTKPALSNLPDPVADRIEDDCKKRKADRIGSAFVLQGTQEARQVGTHNR
jgi:hypothetical protein